MESLQHKRRTIVYDDNLDRIVEGCLPLVNRGDDVKIVYFKQFSLEDDEKIRLELEKRGISQGIVTILDKGPFVDFEYGVTKVNESEIPFPQDADEYRVGALGYGGRYIGFSWIVSQLPKEKITPPIHLRPDILKESFKIAQRIAKGKRLFY